MTFKDYLEREQLDELNWKQAAVLGAALLVGASAHQVRQAGQRAQQEVPKVTAAIGKKMQDTAERIAELATSILSKYKIGEQRAAEIAALAVKYERDTFPKAEDILSVIGIESSFNPKARSKLPKDPALGLMQVRPGVWGITAADLATPEQQVKFGADVLHQYYQKLGDPEDALHAYNVGITNFKRGVNLNPRYVAKFGQERELY